MPGLSERTTGGSPASKWYHSDALGSTRGITDSSQAVTDAILYDAFGMVVSRTGSTATPFGFVGAGQYQTDADSGLMLLGHRLYDASVGRFISSDPAKDGANWYAYCANDPLDHSDPLGLMLPGTGIDGREGMGQNEGRLDYPNADDPSGVVDGIKCFAIWVLIDAVPSAAFGAIADGGLSLIGAGEVGGEIEAAGGGASAVGGGGGSGAAVLTRPPTPAVPLGLSGNNAWSDMFSYLVRPPALGGMGLRPADVMLVQDMNEMEQTLNAAGSIHFNLSGATASGLQNTEYATSQEFQYLTNNPHMPVTYYNASPEVQQLLPPGAKASTFSLR